MHIHQSHWRSGRQWLVARVPGLLLALTAAAAANFAATIWGIPVMLMALLIGIGLNFVSTDTRTAPGLAFASRPVLQVGVALLGLGISIEQVIDLGSDTLLLVIGGVLAAIGSGWAIARLLGRSSAFGILAGGATGICGASAALAISSALPPDEGREREAAFVIVVVTALSTLAMVAYPLLAHWLSFDDRTAGILIGATIHDVAQVVGAGYAVSDEAGDTATVVKLFRVALLLPTVLAISLAAARVRSSQQRLLLPVPLFALAFAVLAIVNSLAALPPELRTFLGDLSRGCLVVAVAAIGLKTSLRGILKMGPSALVVPVGATIVLLALVVAIQLLTGS
ncbi:MAG: putative sulfate exporter family transporter [Devosia sp.]|nr:putative sulfate exporter family transporter [Devosia sp.]